jgi:hypothetical protein
MDHKMDPKMDPKTLTDLKAEKDLIKIPVGHLTTMKMIPAKVTVNYPLMTEPTKKNAVIKTYLPMKKTNATSSK